MAAKRRWYSRGVTLIETVITTAVIGIAAVGALNYEYLAARQAQMAKAQAVAVRIGSFVLEDWKANGGSVYYLTGAAGLNSLAGLNMGFVHTGGGVYRITVDKIPLQVELSRPSGYPDLVPITVTVRWRSDLTDFTAKTISSQNPSLVLATFARADQNSG